jgi:hypothetical protein
VQVGAADAAGLDAQQQLPWSRLRDQALEGSQRLADAVEDDRPHRVRLTRLRHI